METLCFFVSRISDEIYPLRSHAARSDLLVVLAPRIQQALWKLEDQQAEEAFLILPATSCPDATILIALSSVGIGTWL